MSDITTGRQSRGGRVVVGLPTAWRETEMYIHGRNGKFRDRDSYGGDLSSSEG